MSKTKEYSNDEITVIWKPDLCIHSAECVKGSPNVFNSEARPWIKIENSDSKQIMETIDKCPSGALTYEVKDESVEKPAELNSSASIEVKTTKAGPYMLPSEGVKILDSDGNICETKGKIIALCRCGASTNKPLCDGSHKSVDFDS